MGGIQAKTWHEGHLPGGKITRVDLPPFLNLKAFQEEARGMVQFKSLWTFKSKKFNLDFLLFN